MSTNLSSLLKFSVAGAICITVGACKPADKGQGALKSKGVAALNLSKSEANVFAKYFETEPCDVDEMEALGALAGLGLGESGGSGLGFVSREVASGIVSYSDLTIRKDGRDDQVFSAKRADFHCPKMGEDSPTFDRVDFEGVKIHNEAEGVEFTADTLNIASPTLDAARSIIDSITKLRTNSTNDIGFGAMSITGAQIKSNEINGTLKSLSWGEQRNETGRGTADLTIDDVNLEVPGKDGAQDMTLVFEGMSARNMNLGSRFDVGRAMSPNGMMGSVLGNLNSFSKPYDELLIEALTLESEGFSVDFGGIEGKTVEETGIITIRQSLKSTQVDIKPALGDLPQFKRNYDILKSLGFETMRLSGSSVTTLNSEDDSITVSDGLFVLEDALQLNFEYAAEGLNAMAQKAESLSAAGSTENMMTAYEALKLRDLRLTLEDNSIVNRGLKLASEMTGQSEKNIKRSLGMAVFAAAMAAENEVQAEVYSETVEAFADFVKNGGTLTIEANPPAPVSLAPLIAGQGADMDPAALGYSANQESQQP